MIKTIVENYDGGGNLVSRTVTTEENTNVLSAMEAQQSSPCGIGCCGEQLQLNLEEVPLCPCCGEPMEEDPDFIAALDALDAIEKAAAELHILILL